MRSFTSSLKLMLTVVVGLVMSVAFIAPASANDQATAPGAEATWDMSDGEQRVCIPAERPYSTYFVGAIAGSWDTPLIPEAHGLPEGTVIRMEDSIPPGDNGDKYIGMIWLFVDLPPLDYGEYPASLIVTDGTVTKTAPIMIKAQEKWGCSTANA